MTENSECDAICLLSGGEAGKRNELENVKNRVQEFEPIFFFFEAQKIEKGSAMTMSSIKKINL